MTRVTANVSTSVDGYVAGPNDSRENPLGNGGERITGWMLDHDGAKLAQWTTARMAKTVNHR